MLNIIKFITAMLITTFFFHISAANIEIEKPGYGGNGCPNQTAAILVDEKKKTVTIYFDEFQLEAGGDFCRRIKRKSCNMAIPIKVPSGMRVSLSDMKLDGHNFLPKGGHSQISLTTFLDGRIGPRFRKSFKGPLDDEFKLLTKHNIGMNHLSKCGKSVNLRLNIGVILRTNRKNEESFMSLSSYSSVGKLIIQLKKTRC